jgi:hypothetical protein
MRGFLIKVLLGLSLALATVVKSHAVVISFSPATQPGSTGDFVSMDLFVSGLGAGAPPSLGVWDLDVGYDAARLSVDGWILSDELGDVASGDALDLSFGDFGGILSLGVLSLLPPGNLDLLQGSTVTLATITFEVLALGPDESTSVTVDTIYSLGDGFGEPLEVTAEREGTIGNASVPEPASVVLIFAGLLGLRSVARSRV